VAEIYMPISGEVVAVNSNLESSPDLVNNDPYKDGRYTITFSMVM